MSGDCFIPANDIFVNKLIKKLLCEGKFTIIMIGYQKSASELEADAVSFSKNFFGYQKLTTRNDGQRNDHKPSF